MIGVGGGGGVLRLLWRLIAVVMAGAPALRRRELLHGRAARPDQRAWADYREAGLGCEGPAPETADTAIRRKPPGDAEDGGERVMLASNDLHTRVQLEGTWTHGEVFASRVSPRTGEGAAGAAGASP